MKAPNIVYIMSDDHASHAISAYGSKINKTPNLDRIANEGMRFDNTFCTNSICTPSRACILTGKYNHINGVKNLQDEIDGRQMTFPQELQKVGYQTAIVGKWHLGHGGVSDPTGFDYWCVLPGQGAYRNPKFIEMGEEKTFPGYATDIITDLSLDWLNKRDKDRPFCIMVHHKAPHRPWVPDEKHAHMYEDEDVPQPVTFDDDYSTRSQAVTDSKLRITDLDKKDYKIDPPAGLSEAELKNFKYQSFIKDYLRCIASVDDNVGRLLDWLDSEGLTQNTIVIYTSDQGFFLGDHGWFDKRYMYEESLRMPFVVRYPEEIKPGSINKDMILNIDFAPTFMEYAGILIPEDVQGRSIRPVIMGNRPADWRTSMYYRYWMVDKSHHAAPNYGIRTDRYKLIYYYKSGYPEGSEIAARFQPEWELYDLEKDPYEINNVCNDPAYASILGELKKELYRLKEEVKDFEE